MSSVLFMHLLLFVIYQWQEGTSPIISGLKCMQLGTCGAETGCMSCFSALLRLKQARKIYSMIKSSNGIKEVSSYRSSRLSHQGEWACKWGKRLIGLCLVTKKKSRRQFCVCICWKLSLSLQRFDFIQHFSYWCFWFLVREQLVILL